jgi:hypothetical protein
VSANGGRGLTHYRAPDGVAWSVAVRAPGTTNAMVVFGHPDRALRADRYAWYVTSGPEARDVTARLDTAAVHARLTDAMLRQLFLRSMPVESRRPHFEPG